MALGKTAKYIYTYQTKNIVNGKTYIGYHSTNNINDGYIGCGVRSQAYAKSVLKSGFKSAFISAVSKYGYSNFNKEILCFFDTIEEAKEEERYLVDSKWVHRKDTYNLTLGGNGGQLSNIYIHSDSILNDFKNGMFTTHIARKYKVDYTNLSHFLKDEVRNIEPVKPLPYINKYKDIIPEILNNRKTIPGYSISRAMEEYKISFNTIKKIFSGVDMIPNKKEKKIRIPKPIQYKHIGKILYLYEDKYIIDKPVGIFCKEIGMKESNLRMLLCGESKMANRFTLYPVKPVSLMKDGNVVYIKQDLASFARERDIPIISLRYLIEGKIKQTKGYTLKDNGR